MAQQHLFLARYDNGEAVVVKAANAQNAVVARFATDPNLQRVELLHWTADHVGRRMALYLREGDAVRWFGYVRGKGWVDAGTIATLSKPTRTDDQGARPRDAQILSDEDEFMARCLDTRRLQTVRG